MTAPFPAKVAKLLPLLGSPMPGEVMATVAAIGRMLTATGLDWHALAAVVERHACLTALSGWTAAPFSFATIPPRTARKAMALLAGRPGVTMQQRAAMDALRTHLLGAKGHVRISAADAAWLDALWRRFFGDNVS